MSQSRANLLPSQVDSRFAQIPSVSRTFGYKIGYGGDSITNGSNATNASIYSFRAYIRKLLGYRVASNSFNGGVPGERSDQLLARMDNIISQGVQVLSIMIGTNDAAQLVPLSTYQANIKAIKAKADRAGLPIIFCLVPPRGASAAANIKQLVTSYNIWLRFWCTQNGIPLADTFTALVDKTTGDMSAAYDADGVHPNNAGHLELAKAISSVLDTLLPKMPWIVSTKGGGLVTNPLNDSAVAASFAHLAGTAATGSFLVNDGKLPHGDWRRYTLDNSAGSATVNTSYGINMDTTKYAVGDVLLFALYARTSSGGKIQTTDGSTALGIPFDQLVPNEVVPFMFKQAVPATTGAYRIGFNFSAAAATIQTFDVGAFDVFNLTTLGLTDIVV